MNAEVDSAHLLYKEELDKYIRNKIGRAGIKKLRLAINKDHVQSVEF